MDQGSPSPFTAPEREWLIEAPEREWLIEAEIGGGPIPTWTRIAVLAPTPNAAAQRATDALGSDLRIVRHAQGHERMLDEEAELLAQLGGDNRIAWTPPRPSRAQSCALPDRLMVETTPPSAPDLTGFDLLPDAILNATGRIYAVLDGASVFGLVERLESSGLAWKCLFQGEAAETYASAAPYLIELRRDNALVRKLLRPIQTGPKADAITALKSGIFLTSPVSLDGLWRHLRKLTMIEDTAQGKRVYFRFYDPLVFRTLIANLAQDDLAAFCAGINAIGAADAEGAFTTISRQGETA